MRERWSPWVSWRVSETYIKWCCQTSTNIYEQAEVIGGEEVKTLGPDEQGTHKTFRDCSEDTNSKMERRKTSKEPLSQPRRNECRPSKEKVGTVRNPFEHLEG